MISIGITIPTYNREEKLVEILKSIPDGFKVAVSDNGSTISDEVISEYQNVDFVKTPSVVNMFENWNLAIKNMSNCDYIIIPSDDDLYYPDSFNKISKSIKESDDVDIFVFGNNFIDENQKIINKYSPSVNKVLNAPLGFEEFKKGVQARMPSIVFKKTFLDKVGYFDEIFKFTAADSELIQRCLLLGKSAFIPDIISGYRVWEGGLTHKTIATQGWINEISLWTDKISSLASEEYDKINKVFFSKKYEDIIYAENLLVGLVLLFRQKKYEECINHYISCRFPKKATLTIKIKIIIITLLSRIKK